MYQQVKTSDGIMIYMYESEVAGRKYLNPYRECELGSILEGGITVGEIRHIIHGDEAYVLRAWNNNALHRETASAEERLFMRKLSAVSQALEWTYKDIKQLCI